MIKYRITAREPFWAFRYQAQIKRRWFPFWLNLGHLRETEVEAQEYIDRHKKFGNERVVGEQQ